MEHRRYKHALHKHIYRNVPTDIPDYSRLCLPYNFIYLFYSIYILTYLMQTHIQRCLMQLIDKQYRYKHSQLVTDIIK